MREHILSVEEAHANSSSSPAKDTSPEKIVIIIPTYNERNNIIALLDELQTVFQSIAMYDMSILIFDSNSSDKTVDIVQAHQKKYSNIHLLTEEKKSGLGSAYIQAMRYAGQTLKADIVFEFDADGSHRPHYLPKMLEEFTKGADVVMGSRYIAGGSIPKDWGLHRKLLSLFGNIVAKIILTPKIKDHTTGFRGTRTQCLKKIDLNNLRSKGYAYKIELLWRLYLSGAKIIEFPIHFIDRQEGTSKLPRNNAIESLMLIIALRWELIKKKFMGAI